MNLTAYRAYMASTSNNYSDAYNMSLATSIGVVAAAQNAGADSVGVLASTNIVKAASVGVLATAVSTGTASVGVLLSTSKVKNDSVGVVVGSCATAAALSTGLAAVLSTLELIDDQVS